MLVTNETPTKLRQVEKRPFSDTDSWFWQNLRVYVSPDRRRECYGTLPTQCGSSAFPWV